MCVGGGSQKVTGKQAIELALDELNPDSVGYKEVTREPVPLLTIAQSKVEFTNGSQVDLWSIVFAAIFRVLGKKTGLIEQSWEFVHLEVEQGTHGGVVVLVIGDHAREGKDNRPDNDREGELAEDSTA